ncbi:hydrogenase maturation nickel metallochaperone HypA [Ketobacter alkanivorans]|uniref:Hydrogenase maturation factor HypA n=2 Tax=Ketobacter alkanivorans TaxID=1917421 RepID=A0A2K9LPY9_9GAMM|nr:hydrogenase maturation nickel metallochaperone HypA [Ketobacter alkanivorans]MCP5018084.1 hydrogenase maturation nickel metallochaperone HypA [Ketobacter sp.]
MHEMSLCESILQIVEEESIRQSFRKVSEVHLAIGALAGVELEALKFSFDVVVQHSLAAGAVLHIEIVPAIGHCPVCGQKVVMESRYDACSRCGEYGLQLESGNDMRITHLEVQ